MSAKPESPKYFTVTFRLLGLLAVCLIIAVAIFSLDPIRQNLDYHDFADKRVFFEIPNFADVASNIAFLLLGFLGIYLVARRWNDGGLFSMPGERWIWLTLFIGSALVAFGSGYYHLNPVNETLVWDRLAMTVLFMSILAIVIADRLSPKYGLRLFPLLLTVGAGTVLYWIYTEHLGSGDLRPYILAQLIPSVSIPLMLLLFRGKFKGASYFMYALLLYIAAKFLEIYDKEIFTLLHHSVSGHTLKHLFSASAVYVMYLYLRRRKFIAD